jgi:hypothetical protein
MNLAISNAAGILLEATKGLAMDSHLHRLREAIESATRSMTIEDLKRHPEGKWSTAEILEHLFLTYTATVKGFERCLAAGKPLARVPGLKERLVASIALEAGYLGRKRQAPNNTCPRGMAAQKVVTEIGPTILAMDQIITECEARHGGRVRLIDHPMLGPLTGKQWRKFHWVHGQHHVKQILRLRAKT